MKYMILSFFYRFLRGFLFLLLLCKDTFWFTHVYPVWSCFARAGSTRYLMAKCEVTVTVKAAWDKQVQSCGLLCSDRSGKPLSLGRATRAVPWGLFLVWLPDQSTLKVRSVWTQTQAQNVPLWFSRCSDLAVHWFHDGFWISDCFHVDPFWRLRC